MFDHNAIKLELNKKQQKINKHLETEQHVFHDQWVIKEIREGIKKFLKFNGNESTTYQNLWDIAKVVLKGTFIVMNAYIKDTNRPKNYVMLHLKLLEK
jgi:hypothetical protein